MTRFKVGAWAGIAGPVLYVTAWAVAGAARPGYDPTRQAISELAEVGAATRPWMTAAFVVFGLTAIPFAATLRRTLPGNVTAVVVAVVVCGLATVGAGLFPCSPGCPGAGGLTDYGHSLMALVGYLALMAAPALTGRALLRAGPPWRRLALWSLVAAGAGSAAMMIWVLGAFGAAGGTGQRVFNTMGDVWWLTMGVVALRRGPSADRTSLVSAAPTTDSSGTGGSPSSSP